MKIRSQLLVTLIIAMFVGLPVAFADNMERKSARPIDERALKGTYVFAGRVLINPVAAPKVAASPPRLPVDCFVIGEFRFDGKGRIKRRAEIRCPATQEFLVAGLGVPAPRGEPNSSELVATSSTLTAEGTYQLGADGWGSFADMGTFRLGPVPGNPMSSAGRFTIANVRGGIARELVVIIDQQSLQAPGAPMLVNSDIGASFVARRR
ncbi:MAG: hypothetical protein QNJ11_00980 [Woeseiaceae bacterium]|nr:hypothetical protein [Woeseiaceae bacterium]